MKFTLASIAAAALLFSNALAAPIAADGESAAAALGKRDRFSPFILQCGGGGSSSMSFSCNSAECTDGGPESWVKKLWCPNGEGTTGDHWYDYYPNSEDVSQDGGRLFKTGGDGTLESKCTVLAGGDDHVRIACMKPSSK